MTEQTHPSFLLKQQIKAEALRLGFDACGIAAVEEVEDTVQQHFTHWISTGKHAGMEYMERYREQRMNPSQLLEGAKSVIVVVLNYYPSTRIPDHEFQIAWYAYGKDYHDCMREKLNQLLHYIRTLTATEGRICVDTAPILERYWAQKAGLGWIGKHTQLILPGKGSCFFLGEILLKTSLPPDEPMEMHCGSCKRCLEACPSQALSSPFILDAERCLSYQTIENRGPLSAQARQVMGHRIYGCDECQKACPHNRHATPTLTEEFQPSTPLLQMRKNDWLHLSPEQYRLLFKGSAVKRSKYEGLMRNIHEAALSETNKERPL